MRHGVAALIQLAFAANVGTAGGPFWQASAPLRLDARVDVAGRAGPAVVVAQVAWPPPLGRLLPHTRPRRGSV